MKITESKLKELIKECFVKVLNESTDNIDYGWSINMDRGEEKFDMGEAGARGDVTAEITSLIAQANQAYHQAQQRYGDDYCLMNRSDGEYALVDDIKMSRGYVIIKTKSPFNREPDIDNIRCFRTVGGKIVKFTDDDAYPYGGYQYARKMLKQIIKDAATYNQYNDEQNQLNGDDEKAEMQLNRKYGL